MARETWIFFLQFFSFQLMTKKGAKHEKKKYNKKVIIMTFVLMTVFSFLTILSKHSKEPVKSETKTHHSSSFQSSKNARLIRKLPPTLRQLPRRMIKQGILKRRIRIKRLLLLNNQVRSKMAIRLLIKKALKKNQIPLRGRGWEVQKDGSYVTNSDGERVQSSSFNEINEWNTNADNSTYEYPQSSSSANSSLTVN